MSSTPPIKALLAFDAAMKHMSFALAARELSVTPAAVSQQVQKLEDWLGAPLFVREVRQIRPTPAARDYWAAVQPALARIRTASLELRQRRKQEVRLSMPPTLAAKWFAPHMADFMGRHPDIALHLSATTDLADFDGDGIDLAIRHVDSQEPQLDATLLLPDEARLFCAPAYVRGQRLRRPADLARATLLHTTLHPHWLPWLERFAHFDAEKVAALPGVRFDQTLLAIEAARHGRGAVLCSRVLVEAELAAGLLVEPFDLALPLAHAYYLVHKRGAALRPPVQLLKDWLLTIG
jgi:LysR family transcriptional regulator, glycine cleavage system transcriptional activator